MRILFLGTRGYIKSATRLHKRHTSTLFSYKDTTILFDRGIDWLGMPFKKNIDAIFITHAHPDHAWGLQEGAPCPVYASQVSWDIMEKYPITPKQRHVAVLGKKIIVGSITVEPFFVEHSIRCPALGYRITAGSTIIFYSGDIVSIPQHERALRGVQLYIGDGASLVRPIIRKRNGVLFGHAAIATQLTWCKKAGIPRAIFTHCGSQIVEADGRTIAAKVKALGKARGVNASVAHDGMELVL